MPRRIGDTSFTDGTTRPVFEDSDGRQWIKDEREKVYGQWLTPADDAAVEAEAGSAAKVYRPRSATDKRRD